MSKTNRMHTLVFKAQVALAALKGDRTIVRAKREGQSRSFGVFAQNAPYLGEQSRGESLGAA